MAFYDCLTTDGEMTRYEIYLVCIEIAFRIPNVHDCERKKLVQDMTPKEMAPNV